MTKLKLDLQAHLIGDFSLVLSEYMKVDEGILLTHPFRSAHDVEEEFSILETLLAKGKAKALRAVGLAEARVRDA